MDRISIDGLDIQVSRKKIKNMYLRVLPPDGQVRLSAPGRATDESIRAFAASRLGWVQKQRQKLRERPEPALRQFVSGEGFYALGQKYRLEVRPAAKRGLARLEGDALVLYVPETAGPRRREEALNGWLRDLLRREVPPRLEKWEKIIGVRAAEWRIRDMRTRWGSCNPRRKRVWLSLRLAAYPPECLEYVIAHELVHLLEIKHNDRFYGYLDKFYPGWRNVRLKLNDLAREPGS